MGMNYPEGSPGAEDRNQSVCPQSERGWNVLRDPLKRKNNAGTTRQTQDTRGGLCPDDGETESGCRNPVSEHDLSQTQLMRKLVTLEADLRSHFLPKRRRRKGGHKQVQPHVRIPEGGREGGA